ncbi:MAG: efflux RND transporter periplasmic adaptor subunit [Deltaproteobacteria bacterium]|nr:efflux RND transporter periplasmic adaptor subunit [Deltaproteobacteria bacterium]
MTRWIVGLIVLAGLAGLVIWNLGPKEKVRIEVECEKARIEPITQVVTASGKIRPETEVNVAADVGGYIRQLTVQEGDKVAPGQLLVQIDPEIYLARVQESVAVEKTAEANLALAEAALQRAQGESKRVRGLHAKDLVSKANLEKALADEAIAVAQVDAAKGGLMQARAALSKARKDLAKCTIASPIAGTVVLLNKEIGERASGGDFREDIIMQLADLSSMEVEVEVGERDVVLLEDRDPVDIEVDAFPGVTVPGHVKEIANAGTTRNQWTESEVTNFRVVIQVGETERQLRPQMSATVRIQTDFKDRALTVPIQSVTLRRPSEIEDLADGGVEPDEDEAGDAQAGGAGAGGTRGGASAGGTRGVAGAGGSKGDAGEAGGGVDGGAARGGADGGGAGEARGGADGGAKRALREEPVEVVFVVEDGRAFARRVRTGLSSETRIEILEGIETGVQVVSGPYRALSKDLEHGAEVTTEQKGELGAMKRKAGPAKPHRPGRTPREGRRR